MCERRFVASPQTKRKPSPLTRLIWSPFSGLGFLQPEHFSVRRDVVSAAPHHASYFTSG